ncbi:hypothetical protein QBC37DRAFT_20299 [Rhypophila decipiens]|uniref:Uncharacterized protein n=1 Tax=Rhypophila decipiens TaxID=261697 RepID=A0AAN7B7N0_9PEZI|nr:hypothetical protein QBC37DRAFT_20299 [Rhypophila decipiens]
MDTGAIKGFVLYFWAFYWAFFCTSKSAQTIKGTVTVTSLCGFSLWVTSSKAARSRCPHANSGKTMFRHLYRQASQYQDPKTQDRCS